MEHDVTLAPAIKSPLPYLAQNVVGSEIVEQAAGSNGGGTHVCSSSAGHAVPPPDAGVVTAAVRVFLLVV